MPFTRRPRGRKPPARRPRGKTTRGRMTRFKRAYAPYKSARFNFSRARFAKNRYLSTLMSNMNETKLLSTNPINGAAIIGIPVQSSVDASISYVGYMLQSTPTGWDDGQSPPDIKSISGIVNTQGIQSNQHIGQYVYYKKTHLTFQVDMNFVAFSRPPSQFRLIVGKQRSGSTPSGLSDPPKSHLFLKSNGSPAGYLTSGGDALNSFEIMNQPLNRRDYTILKDQRFTLSHPIRSDSDGGGVGYSGYYPVRKNFYLNLPHFKKTRLSSNGEPQDYDAHYFVYIFSTSIGVQDLTPQWSVSGRGTTTYTDA